MNEFQYFFNEKMKILMILHDNQIEIDGKQICPLNQQEIANLVPCGKAKANHLIRELVEDKYIQMVHTKGRYVLTDKGKMILKKISTTK